jgi:hypothetical protein
VIVVIVVIVIVVLAAAVAGFVLARRPKARHVPTRKLLVPFTGGHLDPRVLEAAIRIARAEDALVVAAYLVRVPLDLAPEAPLAREVEVALPLLEAVELEALRAEVEVDARIERGRTATHALRKLWEVERFDQLLVPAPTERSPGLTPKDVAWILEHAPAETVVIKPAPVRQAA